ncbi:hypothetical protein DF182_07350 [Chitinophaga flava]|uniref:Uncharacterized protein n=1 Tax=Chitinophaga flava TaxID=2259036 RepID=A0A365Y364_9BACT|nr:hypothetical protein DF182_07350 [Chitinophaga flava]
MKSSIVLPDSLKDLESLQVIRFENFFVFGELYISFIIQFEILSQKHLKMCLKNLNKLKSLKNSGGS